MINHLRALGKHRIGGIIVPFHSVDKYNNWWDANTDFAPELFRGSRPILWWHLFEENLFMRAGTLDDDSIEVRPEGLYAEGDTFDNEAGLRLMTAVYARDAAFSTGTMPNLWRARKDGYVERWPIVELSVAPADAVVSQRGTTAVIHVRSHLPNIEGDDNQTLERSLWMYPNNHPQAPLLEEQNQSLFLRSSHVQQQQQEQIAPPVAPTPAPAPTEQPPAPQPQPDQMAQVLERLAAVQNELTALRAAPTRQLPDEQPRLAGRISVSSGWDNLSIYEKVFAHTMINASGKRSVRGWDFDDKFYRALAADVERAARADTNDREEEGSLRGLPRIDRVTEQVWSARLPHLRADEAMTTTFTNAGEELVYELFSSVVWREVRLATRVAQHLPIVEMSTDPWNYPIIGRGPTLYHTGEIEDQANFNITNALTPTSQVETDKVIFRTGKLSALTLFSEELVEDANYDVMRLFAESFRLEFARGMDAVVINGDTEDDNAGNINTDSAAPPAGAYYLALDGMRKAALVTNFNNSLANATVDSNVFVKIQRRMGPRGRFGLYPQDLVAIVDPGVYYKLLELDTFESLSDLGERATLLTGMVGSVKGVPVVVSDEIPTTNADGMITVGTPGAQTKGSYLVVNRRGAIIGRRRNISIEGQKQFGTDGRAIFGSMRLDWKQMEDGMVGVGFNVTIT